MTKKTNAKTGSSGRAQASGPIKQATTTPDQKVEPAKKEEPDIDPDIPVMPSPDAEVKINAETDPDLPIFGKIDSGAQDPDIINQEQEEVGKQQEETPIEQHDIAVSPEKNDNDLAPGSIEGMTKEKDDVENELQPPETVESHEVETITDAIDCQEGLLKFLDTYREDYMNSGGSQHVVNDLNLAMNHIGFSLNSLRKFRSNVNGE